MSNQDQMLAAIADATRIAHEQQLEIVALEARIAELVATLDDDGRGSTHELVRPVPRESGRAPKRSDPLDVLEPLTLDALKAAVFLQNQRHGAGHGLKSRHLSRIAADLELALIEKKPQELIERLCLDVAATALRLMDQGDGN